MGATSATGTGLGSADKSQKGSEHLTIGANKIIGPRVIFSGTVTLSGGNGTIYLSGFSGATADYVVLATSQNVSSANAVGASLAISGTTTTITLKGNSSDVVQVVVFTVGLAP